YGATDFPGRRRCEPRGHLGHTTTITASRCKRQRDHRRRLCSSAITPPFGLAIAHLLKAWPPVKALADEIVPATGLRLDLAMTTAHDQPFGCTGHRHIKQPAVLMFIFVQHRFPRLRDCVYVLIAPAGPNDAAWRARRLPLGFDFKQPRLMGTFGRRGSVGQD